jgi:hypothetical protein
MLPIRTPTRDHFIRSNVVEELAWPNVMLMAID